MSLTRWDQAAAARAVAGDRRQPELVALPAGTVSLADLFTFARDAELRFDSLRMRIEELTAGAAGQRLVAHDVALQHVGHAKIVTSEPALGSAAADEIWLSDGETVRTYSPRHHKATARPARRRLRGLDEPGLPGSSRVYRPLTELASPSLADTFVHPGGFCQNVLATGRSWISGSDVVNGREAILVECDHPRTTQLAGDRSDYHIQVAFDRIDGVITRLIERMGAAISRQATVVLYETDVTFPPTTFELAIPEGTHLLY